MAPDHIILGLFLVFAIVNVIANIDEKKHIKIVYGTKPLLMPLLIAYYIAGSTGVNWWIVAALGFGCLGDIFLMLPGEKDEAFVAGLGAFLVNHALYVVAFLRSTSGLGDVPVWLCLLGVPFLIYGVCIYRLLSPGLGKLKGPVIAYMAVILLMGFSALLRWASADAYSFWLVFSGSILFMVSDSVLAWDKFRQKFRLSRVIVMATYIAAQFMIATGFMP